MLYEQSVYKGFLTILSAADGNRQNEHIRVRYRHVEYKSDGTVLFGDAFNATYNSTIKHNLIVIPYKIFGYKL